MKRSSKRLFLAGLCIGLLVFTFLSFSVGPVEISLHQICALFASKLGLWNADGWNGTYDEDTLWTVLWSIRLPRVLLAVMVGAALSAAGAGMQGLFRNPLADPSLIGVSAGAAIGAVLVIVLGGSMGVSSGSVWRDAAISGFAFMGGVGMTFMVYRISRVEGRTVVATMLLTGIAVNALAAAFIGFMVFVSNDQQLRDFTFWSLGSLGGASWKQLGISAPFILLPLAAYPFFARALNAFLLGESEAYHLGIDTQRAKTWIVFLGAAMVGATVAVCGIIGFVGLVIPHLVRLCIGPDHRFLIPGAALLGGLLLLIADLFSRIVVSPAELPIGIVTALCGAPFFLGLLHFSRQKVLG